ncbi:MAG: terminase family protein, partial [Leptospiraceae bacterium]|nr:terminase family protein [Leptospiraceae bacterium]
QAAFARLHEQKFSGIVGGFGSGKSQSVVYRAMTALKERNYATVVIVAPSYSLLQDVNIPDFEQIFAFYNIRYEHLKSQRRFIVNSGNLTGEIWFRSADRPEKIVGFDATDIIIDEFDIIKVSKQKELWRKCLGRLRGDDHTTLSIATTPEGFRETYRLFQKERIGPLIRAKTTDNIFLPADYVQSLFDQYDEQLVNQYVNAQFVNINGLMAYYAFDRDRNHRRTEADEWKRYETIGVGMDFNVSKMCAMLFIHDSK